MENVAVSPSSSTRSAMHGGGAGTGGGQAFTALLHACRVEKGSEHTHTSMKGGTYYVPGTETDRFFALYEAALAGGEDLFLTEHHRHIGPVLVDLDFRFEPMGEEVVGQPQNIRRRYTPELLLEVARVYGDALARRVRTPETFDIYVTEKSQPTMHKGLIKDGVHLMIPAVVTRPEVQLIVRTEVLSKLAQVFDACLQQPLANRVEDVVDEAVIQRNNWLMYGSKKPGSEPYVATWRIVYDSATGRVEAFACASATSATSEATAHEEKGCSFVQLFSIRNKYDECELEEATQAEVDRFVEAAEERRKHREAVQAVLRTDGADGAARANTCDDLDRVVKLVELLHVSRTDSYNDWVRVGWCLRNIDHRLLDKWIEFSKKSVKYVDGECEQLWNKMRSGGLGIGTLHMWARHDEPDRYRELLRLDLTELIVKSANGTHHDMAKVVHHLYRYQYVCSSIRNKTWYEFRDHRWHESDSAYTLRKRISNEVFKEVTLQASNMLNRSVASNDDQEQKTLGELSKKLTAVALQLKKTNFKDNVVKECAELFMVEKFEDLLDADCNLVGFENGVYDLERHEFREGRPDDHISYTTGISYVPYDPAHPIVHNIQRFLEQIHPAADVRAYVLRSLASCLSGNVLIERFNIWTGTGANGKSVTVNLMEKAFGDYACKFPVTLLTQKRAASNAASSEIARAKGRRFGVLQEPSEDEKLNIGLMKELSGGDKIQCRQLYKNPVEWKPQFKLFLLCNHLPTVPSEDGGTWRRIRVVEFGSKFVDTPSRDNEFPIDLELPTRLDSWKEHFMAMLIDYHKRFGSARVEDPEAVTACTREYQRNNDILADFIDSCIATTPDPTAMLHASTVLDEWNDWVKQENLGSLTRTTKGRDVLHYIERSFNVRAVKIKGGSAYRGYCLRRHLPSDNAEETAQDTEP